MTIDKKSMASNIAGELIYSATTANESFMNDGSITDTITLTLNGDTFYSGLIGQDLNNPETIGCEIIGIPNGLTAKLVVIDTTTAKLSFTGQAESHFNTDNAADLQISFFPTSFTSNVIAINADQLLSVEFNVKPRSSWSTSTFNQDIGEILDGQSSVLTLNEATFVKSGLDLTKFISNVPVGVTASLIVSDETHAVLTLWGQSNSSVAQNLIINIPNNLFTDRVSVAGAHSEISLTFYDYTAPAAPIFDTITDDNVINLAERSSGVLVSGTSEANASILLYSDVNTINITADTNGVWNYQLTETDYSTNAVQTLYAEATDSSGNASGTATQEISVNLTLPEAPYFYSVADDYVINAAEKVAGVIISGETEEWSWVSVIVGSNAPALATVDGTIWSYQLPNSLIVEGDLTIFATTTNFAGNESDVSILDIVVDTLAPNAPAIDVVSEDNLINLAESEYGVTITGTAEAGSTVSVMVNYGEFAPTVIDGNGNWSYTISGIESSDIVAVATDAAGNVSESAENYIEYHANTLPTGAVTIKGEAKIGNTLSVSNTLKDTDGLGAIVYGWWSGDYRYLGEGNSLKLAKDETGQTVYVTADYTDKFGTAESVQSAATKTVINVNHQPSGSLLIQGIPNVGSELSVKNELRDADGLGVLESQWFANGEFVGTGDIFALTDSEIGKTIQVTVSYTDGTDNFESVSSLATQAITKENNLPIGSLVVKGEARVGKVLSIVNTLEDADGLGLFDHQWFADDEAIRNANQDTYKATKADVGKKISVEVSYTDGENNYEDQFSLETVAVKVVAAISGLTKKGDAKNNTLEGATKNDDLSGLAGVDTLLGKAGNDTLNGGAGNDNLTGGAGFDDLTGGTGADRFIFTDIKDASISSSNIDTILDLKTTDGDKIDLSGIDANSKLTGNQAFNFTGNTAFSTTDAAGQLRFDATSHILYGSTNADNKPEFSIQLNGVSSLVIGDFFL